MQRKLTIAGWMIDVEVGNQHVGAVERRGKRFYATHMRPEMMGPHELGWFKSEHRAVAAVRRADGLRPKMTVTTGRMDENGRFVRRKST